MHRLPMRRHGRGAAPCFETVLERLGEEAWRLAAEHEMARERWSAIECSIAGKRFECFGSASVEDGATRQAQVLVDRLMGERMGERVAMRRSPQQVAVDQLAQILQKLSLVARGEARE